MKNKITNNWLLKLLSLVFSFFLWVIVTNTDDPTMEVVYNNIPVTLKNADIITSQGQVYEILDNTDVVTTVKVKAPRSITDSLDEDNIIATADFNNLTLQNTIEIDLSSNKYSNNIESITGDIEVVKLNIEALKSKTLALTVSASDEPGDGYLVGDISPAQNQVRISGPESIVSRVVRAEAEISVEGFTQDISTDADIRLLDADGNIIDPRLLTLNIKSVRVNVEILQTKRVGLEFSTIGTPADNYEETGVITASPDSIVVAGRAAALKNLDTVKIPSDALNITGQTGDMMTLVNVSSYLPNGISLSDTATDGTVSVTVGIERLSEKRITLNAADIVYNNIPEGYTVELVDPEETYDVVIKGLRTNLNNITKENITATANLTDILEQEDTAGSSYHTTLKFSGSGGEIRVAEPVQIWIKLNEANE